MSPEWLRPRVLLKNKGKCYVVFRCFQDSLGFFRIVPIGKPIGFSHIFVLLSCGFTPTGEHIYFFVNGDRAPVYVALLDTKPSSTVRPLPIQRAAAVVMGCDFPTYLFSLVVGLLPPVNNIDCGFSTVGKSLPVLCSIHVKHDRDLYRLWTLCLEQRP